MEKLQDVQKYSADIFPVSLGLVRDNNLDAISQENIFAAFFYITLFLLSIRILLNIYYRSVVQNAQELFMLMKYDFNNRKGAMGELMNKVSGPLNMFKMYVLNELNTILGVIVKKLTSTNEDVKYIQGYPTQDNLMNSYYDNEHYDNEYHNDADYKNERQRQLEQEEQERQRQLEQEEEERQRQLEQEEQERQRQLEQGDDQDNKEDEEDHDGNEQDSMQKGLGDRFMTEFNSGMKFAEANSNLYKFYWELAQNKPPYSFTKEGDEDMIKDTTDEESLKNSEDADEEATTDSDIKENVIEKKTEKDSNTNEEMESTENITLEPDTKGQSKSETGEQLKRATGVPSKRATRRGKKTDANAVAKRHSAAVPKRQNIGPSKHVTSGVAKRDTRAVHKRETSGQENPPKNEQAQDKTNEEPTNVTQEANAGIQQDKMKKKLNLKNIISKDKENSEKGANADNSNKTVQTEEWKVNEWNKWLQQIDEQWHFFFLDLQNKTTDWMKQTEGEFKKWTKEMETKWMNYNHNLDKEYGTDLYKKYPTWNESQWTTWMKTDGKKLIQEEWIKWINDHDSKLSEWVNYDWCQWRSLKKFNWELSQWKSDEYEHWAESQNGNLALLLHKKKRKKYLTWKNRIEREKSEWDSWVQSKDELIVKSKADKWDEWKNEKRQLFCDWMENFINTWIRRKQWNSWVTERRNVLSGRESSAY
ncbi:hypothetical protein AK88_02728 [Plasmodium fragile]|uniref:Tryptophan/threonine-rich plasmodium antigen C-terminal domain-containing protein n=1 Tax=Plasmodium fragile TaxID=5857 RepID=A0A0D9QL76_PLAFR|nr:uncharacterized protein AK88_02728 [Plasmodium fragile]KJP87562.1 hypothetical protein AK88_02728 [Plasmodium fragile]